MKENKNNISNIDSEIKNFTTSHLPSVNDFINILIGVPIVEFNNLTNISNLFRNRLLGFNASDYYERFGNVIESIENFGDNVTRINSSEKDTDYLKGTNIQWNENNSSMIGMDDSRDGSFNNPDSILFKTKLLFDNKKIDSIVARFHTEGNVDTQDIGRAGLVNSNTSTRRYGMSHGRNLLTKEAEKGSDTRTEGYTNPYCRVWTHFHQYNSIDKLIRPFTDVGTGNPTSIGDLQKNWKFIRGENGAKKLNDNSVLNKNGFINITPSYEENENLKVHTKKCMFSIENLAWKGYSKYDFEKSLSWEQRGPMGGRIMWFPPYDIKFSESTNVNWNADSFIGRGEKVYTYVDTERSGTLSFKLVVDHPSIINYFGKNNSEINNNGTETISETKDTDLLRFFAGCDTIEGNAKPLTDEVYNPEGANEVKTDTVVNSTNEPESVFTEEEPVTQGQFVFYVYYPNNYSGADDKPGNVVEAMAYLLNGVVCQKESDGERDGFLQFSDLSNKLVDNFMGTGYEMSKEFGISHLYEPNGKYGAMKGKFMSWYYRVDEDTIDEKLTIKDNEFDQDVSQNKSINGLNVDVNLGWEDADYSFSEVAYVLSGIELIKNKASKEIGVETFVKNINNLKKILQEYKIIKVVSEGLANSHGNNPSNTINQQRNNSLAKKRGETVLTWLKTFKQFSSLNSDNIICDVHNVEHVTTRNVSDIDAKKKRSAKVTIFYETSKETTVSDTKQSSTITNSRETNNVNNFQENKIVIFEKDDLWEYGEKNEDGVITLWKRHGNAEWIPLNEYKDVVELGEVVVTAKRIEKPKEFNNMRYDQEYHFFKVLKEKNPMVWEKFTEKIKYFTPAFHSMTPEGFNGRLTFLQQCCRQGNTVGASDKNSKTASNLSFGNPPICVLRLGDFYNTKIVITNVNFDFDPLQWDLNSEGIGVQPLIANVSISFNFIGGSDLTGPISRLQNAMTFNYYANSSVYDNRADTVEYDENGEIINYNAYLTPLSNNNDKKN